MNGIEVHHIGQSLSFTSYEGLYHLYLSSSAAIVQWGIAIIIRQIDIGLLF
jgi:hypothetical protein